MIAIRNISPKIEPTGMHEYEVRINRGLLTTFWHNREDGLVVCLKKASEAVYDELIVKPAIRIATELDKKKSVKRAIKPERVNNKCKKRIRGKDEARTNKKGS